MVIVKRRLMNHFQLVFMFSLLVLWHTFIPRKWFIVVSVACVKNVLVLLLNFFQRMML
jgi:hypothetical protein